ncbi:PH domain-containing protein [Paenibacillus sp. 481]|nr:PH domain-containing protein [Paenibacillus sp. 481]UHA75761.1 PH domain-containing protein [Paenibacillus sp. 481]
MDTKLTQRLHPDWVKSSRLASFIFNGVCLLLSIAYVTVAYFREWSMLPGWIALGLFAVSFALFGWVVPKVEFRIFAFDVYEEEIEIQSGFIFISNVLIPMVRVQHVELESGPISRMYDLAEIKIVTAATTHTIKGVKREQAEALKRRIGDLAKVVDEHE